MIQADVMSVEPPKELYSDDEKNDWVFADRIKKISKKKARPRRPTRPSKKKDFGGVRRRPGSKPTV